MRKLIVLVALLFVGCTKTADVFVDAKIVPMDDRKIGVEVLGKQLTSGFLKYDGMHKNVGVKFNLQGHRFTEIIRIDEMTYTEYADSGWMPLRVVVMTNGDYMIYAGNKDGLAKPRQMSKAVARDIVEKELIQEMSVQ